MISPSHIISFYQVEFSILCFVVAMFVINTFLFPEKGFKPVSYLFYFAKLASVIYIYQVTCKTFISCNLCLFYSGNLGFYLVLQQATMFVFSYALWKACSIKTFAGL